MCFVSVPYCWLLRNHGAILKNGSQNKKLSNFSWMKLNSVFDKGQVVVIILYYCVVLVFFLYIINHISKNK